MVVIQFPDVLLTYRGYRHYTRIGAVTEQIRDDASLSVGMITAVDMQEFIFDITGYEPSHCSIFYGLCLCQLPIVAGPASSHHVHHTESCCALGFIIFEIDR